MASTIKIKNSSTASAVPTSSDLVQGELAVNVTDKRIFTENASGTVVELGTNPSIITLPDGSASAPTLTNDGDTNTGIFFPAADTVAVATGGTERVRVDSSGNVGIGTSSPTTLLTLGSGTFLVKNASGDSNGLRLYQDTGDTSRVYNYFGGPLAFGTNNTERARIDSSGNLLVGTTTVVSSSTGGASFETATNSRRILRTGTTTTSANNLAEFYNPNGAVGSISVSGSTTTFSTSSDYRLKENVAPMTGALNVIQQLKPVTYSWKADGSSTQGFIAHELQEVVPECVVGEKDAVDADGNPVYQGIDTSFLVATLTAAIQEQQALITTLTERITALEQA